MFITFDETLTACALEGRKWITVVNIVSFVGSSLDGA